MHKHSRDSASAADSAARIFRGALTRCLTQTRSKSDLIHSSNGCRSAVSDQKSVLGSNHSISSLMRNGEKLNEMPKNDEIYKLETNRSVDSNLINLDLCDNQSECTKQKENITVLSPIRYFNASDVEEPNAAPTNCNESKKKMKSVISVVHHLSVDSGDSDSSKFSRKRSASQLLNDSPESEHHRLSNFTMSERWSDTALVRPEPELYKSHHSAPSYASGNLNRRTSFKSRSCESFTPTSRFSDKRNNVRQHHRSLSFPNKRSSADVTPYSPSRFSESPVGRTKRMRTSSYIPPYDLSGISLKPPVRVIDSHCHLDFLFTRAEYHGSYSNYRSKHSETFLECYEGCITIFCEPRNFSLKPNWDSILQEEGVWAAFGCHPHKAQEYDEDCEKALIEALKDPKVVALGEIGLDYSKRNNCNREQQKRVLLRQLDIALEHELPLVIHCREAHDDCIEIMREVVPKKHFIHLHCFTDTWERAEEWLHEFPNLFIGITNLVTFPTAEEVHEIAKNIPLERLLLETDTPYFVPRLLSMRWSNPGMVIHAAAQIAAFRTETTLQDLLRTVRENTHKMYGI